MINIFKADKFKDMGKKQLVEYVWDYYKLPIIAGVIGVLVIGSIINSVFINPPDKQYVGVIIYGESVADAGIDMLNELLTDELVPADLKPGYTARVDNLYGSSDMQVSMAMQQKFMALMMLGEVDVVITGMNKFDELMGEGGFIALGDVLTAQQFAELDGRLLTREGAHYGVDLTDSAVLESCGILLENPVAGIISTGKQPEIAASALEILAAQ